MSYKNALKEYIDATNTHDFDNVKLLLHPDAIYWFTDRSCTTIEEIGKYLIILGVSLKMKYIQQLIFNGLLLIKQWQHVFIHITIMAILMANIFPVVAEQQMFLPS